MNGGASTPVNSTQKIGSPSTSPRVQLRTCAFVAWASISAWLGTRGRL
jgi:hypothetical protein